MANLIDAAAPAFHDAVSTVVEEKTYNWICMLTYFFPSRLTSANKVLSLCGPCQDLLALQ